MAEQALALKAEAPVVSDVCLVSNGVWQVSFATIAALCDGLQARRIFARTNAALVDMRGLGSCL